ncbi:Hypothetical_protein [Hexamita inflata]|uniref:Hypothetical_protein n=1 Tax=Hexamita inflata TaxID=28002 RepID=A0AA86RDH1_9EUKA|nr:Hypothetical protein HINF_LOCUS63874 [Hexamita inflata]
MQLEDVKKQYLKLNPQYTLKEPTRKAQEKIDKNNIFDYLLMQYNQVDSYQKFQNDLNLYTCVAQCNVSQNGQLCQFCPKDKAQTAQYVCSCGQRYCSINCYKMHKISDTTCQGTKVE